jgi:hypothetical protein
VRDKKSFEYIAPQIEEEPGYLYMYLQHKVDFFLVVQTEIKLKQAPDQTSQIMIRVKEHDRQWNYSLREKEMEKQFYECLLDRMKTGKWKPLPWEIKYKRKPNDF